MRNSEDSMDQENFTQAKPIIFSTDMVRAILEGRKTQTRRILRPRPVKYPIQPVLLDIQPDEGARFSYGPDRDGNPIIGLKVKPHYNKGDSLWVRETWRVHSSDEGTCCYEYKADGKTKGTWRPSIHMPRSAARIYLKVSNVRAERLQNITIDDAIAEGVQDLHVYSDDGLISTYKRLWDSLNGMRIGYAWDDNPWVWVYEFERVAQMNGKYDKIVHALERCGDQPTA
jgi:hypothetical protein